MRFSACPRNQTSPASGCSNPAMIRRSVVFPQPDGPSKQKKSPLRTSRSTPTRACTLSKFLLTPSTRSQLESGSISGIGIKDLSFAQDFSHDVTQDHRERDQQQERSDGIHPRVDAGPQPGQDVDREGRILADY